MSTSVTTTINYLAHMTVRPRYHAYDLSRDNLQLAPTSVSVADARPRRREYTLDAQGFALADHSVRVSDFRDAAAVTREYIPQVEELLLALTGARRVYMTPAALLRFGERSRDYRARVNSHPARFAHVDYSDTAAPALFRQRLPAGERAWVRGRRVVGLNIWRVLTPPPQDVPLGVCDIRSVAPADYGRGDAVFDAPGQAEWSFEGFLIHASPAHRWHWFRDMTVDEALVFKAYDSRLAQPAGVPHCAFDDPSCPPNVPPRASVEARAFAVFDESGPDIIGPD